MIEQLPANYTIIPGEHGLYHPKKGKKILKRANRQPVGHSDYNVVLKSC